MQTISRIYIHVGILNLSFVQQCQLPMSKKTLLKQDKHEEQCKPLSKIFEKDPPKQLRRNRRSSMSRQYEAQDPIHSTKRKAAPIKFPKETKGKKSVSKRKSKPKKSESLAESNSQNYDKSSSSSNDSSSSQSQSDVQTRQVSKKKKKAIMTKSKDQKQNKETKRNGKKSEGRDSKKQQQIQQQKQGQVKAKSKAKGYVYKPPKQKPVQKQESINEIMRQYSKISRKKKRKSNFYLDKIDSMKWGEPVGRGAKKLRLKMEQAHRIRKQKEKQRKKQEKKARQLRLLEKEKPKSIKVEPVVLSDSDNEGVKVEAKFQNIEDERRKLLISQQKTEFTINQFVLEKLIDIYTFNAYDLGIITKQLPHLTIYQIRYNLNILFLRCLDKIQLQCVSKCKEKIQLLTDEEKYQLVSQLYKRKRSNLLLGTGDIEFNQYFNKVLYSIKNSAIEFEEKEVRHLWQKISTYVRSQKSQQIKEQQYDQNIQAIVKTETYESTIKKQEPSLESKDILQKIQEGSIKQQKP